MHRLKLENILPSSLLHSRFGWVGLAAVLPRGTVVGAHFKHEPEQKINYTLGSSPRRLPDCCNVESTLKKASGKKQSSGNTIRQNKTYNRH